MRRTTAAMALVVTILLVAGACTQATPDTALDVPTTPADSSPASPTPTPTPVLATPTPVPTTATPTPAATPTPDGEASVATVQQQLAELHYYVGDIDGKAGPATASAVQAFQKVNGLSADGAVGPNTLAALADPAEPTLRGGPSNRIEVDLDRQVAYLVEGGSLTRIMPISSGSGETYGTSGGGTARSLTPVGTYTVERRISGERHADLGTLYDPMYFYRGWAIHGSNSVPAYPASHGCVRVTRADARWLFDHLPVGTTVIVYGDRNAFDPRAGESAGTAEPAGDTADTTPPDGIQTPEPTPTTSEPTSSEGSGQPTPAGPQPSQPGPSQPGPSQPGPSQPQPTQAPSPQPDPTPPQPQPEPTVPPPDPGPAPASTTSSGATGT